MIVDVLDRAARWTPLHPGFESAFAFLREAFANRAAVAHGKQVLVQDRLWVVIEAGQGRTQSGAPLEFHRRYIDIQLVLEGAESIGWTHLAEGVDAGVAFDVGRDIGFLSEPPRTWLHLAPGEFAVFFPSDAHAPLAGSGPVLKAVAKIAIDW